MRICKCLFWIVLAATTCTLILVGAAHSSQPQRRVQLADGRVLQIEGVTFGTNHVVGSQLAGLVETARAALPASLGRLVPGMRPLQRQQLRIPSLIVWVSTFDSSTGQEVNAGGLGIDIIGDQGEVYRATGGSAVAGRNFSRYAHVFDIYPRTQRKLTLRVTPEGTKQSSQIEIRNPHIVRPAAWTGSGLPQTSKVGDMEVALLSLAMRTNWFGITHTPIVFWEPVFELRDCGHIAVGWDSPLWEAEDPTGNRGRWLGVHQPVLRFDASFYPNPTNTQAAMVIGTSAPIVLDTLSTNISLWNLEMAYEMQKIVVLGLFPAGAHVFSDDKYLMNPPIWSGGRSSGRPSGWEFHRKDRQWWWRHHAPVPTIYIREPQLPDGAHLGVRLRDQQGHYWPTKLEQAGNLRAYLLDAPSDGKSLVAEFVVLKLVRAQFFVDTKSMQAVVHPLP